MRYNFSTDFLQLLLLPKQCLCLQTLRTVVLKNSSSEIANQLESPPNQNIFWEFGLLLNVSEAYAAESSFENTDIHILILSL